MCLKNLLYPKFIYISIITSYFIVSKNIYRKSSDFLKGDVQAWNQVMIYFLFYKESTEPIISFLYLIINEHFFLFNNVGKLCVLLQCFKVKWSEAAWFDSPQTKSICPTIIYHPTWQSEISHWIIEILLLLVIGLSVIQSALLCLPEEHNVMVLKLFHF